MPAQIQTAIGPVVDALSELLDSDNDSQITYYISDAIEEATDVMHRTKVNPQSPELKSKCANLQSKLGRLTEILSSKSDLAPMVTRLQRSTEDFKTAVQSL